jgi:hypothetical protein
VYHFYTDYSLLAAIIEKVSGLSYKDFMQQNIFTPLHLTHTNVFTELQVTKKLHSNHTESIAFNELKQQFLPGDSNSARLNTIIQLKESLVKPVLVALLKICLYSTSHLKKPNTTSVNLQRDAYTLYSGRFT